ncbi:ATP-binding response regulator [Marinicella litoralis]|nr:ATP-binding protein [Marinicella litoralis]
MLLGFALYYWHQIKQIKIDMLAKTNELNSYKKQQQVAKATHLSAEAANAAKIKYLSGISHELRTPLNVIMGYAQLLENKTATDDPNHHSFQLIRTNCEHLTHLIEGILEFSAIESGKLRVQSDVLDLKQLLNHMGHMFSLQATQKNLQFKYHINENLPQFVKTDPKRLKQILINLLSNAIKFTAKGCVSFDVSYRYQIATFVIKDTGCGIASSDTERIFQPFERIQTTASNIPGTGLGLTIANLLVELLGGELKVKSELGQGSEFTLKLMLSAQNPPTTSDEFKVTPEDGNHHKILIVDDIEEHRTLIQNILQPYGFKTWVAKDVSSAKKMIEKHGFDLMLLDVAMPNENGWALAQWCTEQNHPCKICMISANPRDIDPQRHPHHQAYIAKPIQINQLLTVINQLLKLGWDDQNSQPLETSQPKPVVRIKRKDRLALTELVEIGHLNGIETYLNTMYENHLISDTELKQLLKPIKQLNLTQFTTIIGNHDKK